LQVVTTDGASGLTAALDLVHPLAQRPRCWVHKLRNLSHKLPRRHRQACLQGARAIYLAATRREAVPAFRAWPRHWQPLEPKAVACLAQDIEALLVCLDVPGAHRKKIRTTKPLERAFPGSAPAYLPEGLLERVGSTCLLAVCSRPLEAHWQGIVVWCQASYRPGF